MGVRGMLGAVIGAWWVRFTSAPWRLGVPLLVLGVALGCGLPGFEAQEPPVVREQVYLAYKQPNRDANYPTFQTLLADSDGSYFEIDARGLPYPYRHDWGRTKRVLVQSRRNAYTGYTDSSVTEVLEDVEAIAGSVRIYGISAPYFGEDSRSFIDGKALSCGSEALCAALDEALGGPEKFDLVLGFGASWRDPLVVQAVEAPTCYGTMDCRSGQACCAQGESHVCLQQMTCAAGEQVEEGRRVAP